MKVNTCYFGLIAEERGVNKEELNLPEGASLEVVQEKALELIPGLASNNYAVAVNQKLHTGNIDLKEGDEISFFPPFAGG